MFDTGLLIAAGSAIVMVSHTGWIMVSVKRQRAAWAAERQASIDRETARLVRIRQGADALARLNGMHGAEHRRANRAEAAYTDLKAHLDEVRLQYTSLKSRAYLRDDKGRIRKASEIL